MRFFLVSYISLSSILDVYSQVKTIKQNQEEFQKKELEINKRETINYTLKMEPLHKVDYYYSKQIENLTGKGNGNKIARRNNGGSFKKSIGQIVRFNDRFIDFLVRN